MLATEKMVAFLATTQPDACRQFYEGALGLRFLAEEPDALVFESGGNMLRIGKIKEFEPLPFTVLGWQVADLAATLDEIAGRGVGSQRFDGIEQDDRRVASFGQTRVAWLKDPDGNILSLAEVAG
jgi:catechol 2,3-dioxygenase-like lactoylglutathione lyase family enzyme